MNKGGNQLELLIFERLLNTSRNIESVAYNGVDGWPWVMTVSRHSQPSYAFGG